MALDATVLILTDGKMGDLSQCRGIARALAEIDNITERKVDPKGVWALPLPMVPVAREDRESGLFDEPVPDIVIASGRRTVPYLRAFAKMKNGPFTIFLKDPRHSRSAFDFIWAPDHDALRAPNVLSTSTAPHTLSKDVLAMTAPAAVIELGFVSQAVGIILGGDSGPVKWDKVSASAFASLLEGLPDAEKPIIVSSRRTPDVLRESVEAVLPEAVWPERSGIEQPYLKTLSVADRLIVTGDSHNMVSEALATGAAVHVHRPPGLHRKLEAFLDMLEVQGLICDLKAGFERGRQPPVDATPQIAAEAKRRFLLKSA